MNPDEFDTPPAGEPERDRKLGGMLARAESLYVTSDLAVSRQRYRIGVAARRQFRAQMNERAPGWVEWVARGARPLPIAIAATLVLTAVGIMASVPRPTTEIALTEEPTTAQSVESLAESGGTSAQIIDALIAPTTSDSLLARALAAPGNQ